MSSISDRIKKAVAESGKTQSQIAEEIGITKATMSRYIHGSRIPKATIMYALSKACDVSVEYFDVAKEEPKKHVEMIIDYVVDDEDFQYYDNHGILTRCIDCKFWDDQFCKSEAKGDHRYKPADAYCSDAVRKVGGKADDSGIMDNSNL